MIDTNTLNLIFAMAVFIVVTGLSVHRHNAKAQVQKKRGEVEDFVRRLSKKIEILDTEIVELKLRIDELDEEIESYSIQKNQ